MDLSLLSPPPYHEKVARPGTTNKDSPHTSLFAMKDRSSPDVRKKKKKRKKDKRE